MYRLVSQHSFLQDLIDGWSVDEEDIELRSIEEFKIPGLDVYVIPTFWLDIGGDANSVIEHTVGVELIREITVDPGVNITTGAQVFKKVGGPVILALLCRIEGHGTCLTMITDQI